MGPVRPGETQAPPTASRLDKVVVLGRFGAPFGVQGWVKLESFTDPPDQVVRYPGLRAGAAGGVEVPTGAATLAGGATTGAGAGRGSVGGMSVGGGGVVAGMRPESLAIGVVSGTR